jgi:hypothetical protein
VCFLPLVPVPLVLVLLLVFRPGLLRARVDSPRAAAIGAGIAVVGLLVLAVGRRRSWTAGLWTASAVVLVLMAVVLWPAFRERTVNEAFPVVLTASTAAPVVTPSTPRPTPTATRSPASKPAATVAAATAVRRLGGRWRGTHNSAPAALGSTTSTAGSSCSSRTSASRARPGPRSTLIASGKRSPQGGIRLGALKGERGSFSYPVTAGFDVSRGWTALVWCDPYDTPIAAADLT